MKTRIRSIFWLMTVCILGINLFQVYWLYTTYQLHYQQFSRTVKEAMFEALQKQQLSEAQRFVGKKIGAGKGPARIFFRQYSSEGSSDDPIVVSEQRDTAGVRLRLSNDQLLSGLRSKVTVEVHRGRPDDQPSADSMARRLSNLLVFRWAEGESFDLKKMAKTYQTELIRRDVEAEFVLDTLSFPARKHPVNLATIRPQPHPGYAIQTPPVPINPVKGTFLQASFKTPTSYILRRMGWILGSSVLLLVLTTGCFLFMLSTILRQKKLSDIKNDFINNMTHELKTPIATVSAAVEAMQHFGALNDPKKTETYLSISRNELQRLSDLVEKVLNMAVEEQRELVLNSQLTNPSELVQELVQRHQLKAAKPVTFQVDVDPEPVLIDQVHFGNVINNLIDNAIKYSSEQVMICINGGYGQSGWQLSVADDGIGIPKGYQEAIFDRFFRVPTGNLHPVKGFGLGLYYVRQVIERHRGTIDVRSEAGKGSEFIITLASKHD